MMIPKCLIIGGAGFIGSYLVEHLVSRGVTVSVLDRGRDRLSELATRVPALKCYTGDVEQADLLADALLGCDVLIYLAHTTIPASAEHDPGNDIASNIFPLLKAITAAAKAGVRRIVLTSSGGTVYGRARHTPIPETHPTDPLCAYGICKLAIEKYTRLYASCNKIESICLRLANPFGPGQSMTGTQGAVSVFLGRILRGSAIDIWGDGSVVRDYVYIADVASALEAAALAPLSEPHPVVNIGTGTGTSLTQLISVLEEASETRAQLRFQEARELDVPTNILDIGRAKLLLNYRPRYDLRQGVKEYFASLRAQTRFPNPETQISSRFC